MDQNDRDSLKGYGSYELSIHHVDKIVGSIFVFSEEFLQNFEFIYVSDHGEIPYVGHGWPTDNNETYIIPLFMRQSEFCDIMESYRRKDGWLSSGMIKYILAEMMGYSIEDNCIKNEIADSINVLDEEESLLKYNTLRDMWESMTTNRF